MDETAYKQWWLLHRRTALGEPLSVEEQAQYESGLRQLEADELPIQSSINELRQARQQMLTAQAEYEHLQKRYQEIQAEVTALETRLDEPTRQLLGVGK